jgi:hypothetical protein
MQTVKTVLVYLTLNIDCMARFPFIRFSNSVLREMLYNVTISETTIWCRLQWKTTVAVIRDITMLLLSPVEPTFI